MNTVVKPESHYKTRAPRVYETDQANCQPAKPDSGDESSAPRSLRRFIYAAVGVAFVVLGAFGAVLPGIPTVGPLLLASWFFARSCPPLERILVRNRFFRRFHHYLDHGAEMPFRARAITISAMWLSIGMSIALLYYSGQNWLWLILLIVAAGFAGTWFIARFRGKVAGRLEVNSGGTNP
jgi:uncharacterized membrane protein YbaN (DUF454 family)